MITGVEPRQALAVLAHYKKQLRNQFWENVLLAVPVALAGGGYAILNVAFSTGYALIGMPVLIIAPILLIWLLWFSVVVGPGRWCAGILAGYVDSESDSVYTTSFLLSKGAVVHLSELVKTKEYHRLIIGRQRCIIEFVRPSDNRKFYLIEGMFGNCPVIELAKT